MTLLEKIKDKKNIVFVGESGCGKTELSINLAVAMAQDPSNTKKINLLDMDQTKFIFRSRDLKDKFESKGVNLVGGAHFLDAPIVPPGTERLLKDPDSRNILDVGGNEIGAVSLGQFSELLNKPDSQFFIVVNPYRLLSVDGAHINAMISGIRKLGKIDNIEIIGNPHVGDATTEEYFFEGLKMFEERIKEAGLTCDTIALPKWLDYLEDKIDGYNTCVIERYIEYP